MIDIGIFRDSFGTDEMRALFEEQALVQLYMDVEAALARAQAKLGIVPRSAADAITASAKVDIIDFAQLRANTAVVGYPVLPLVQQWSRQIGEAGKYLHWGATTQDIMDTAVVLQCRAAFTLIARQLDELRSRLKDLAIRHRETPMAGRTHLQQALPITFGYKAAVWLSMFDRHAERLRQLASRLYTAQLGGAAGTLASLGADGLAVHEAFAEELDLNTAAITWHVARDSLAEAIQLLALVSGSLAKVAFDVMLLMSTECAEVYEPFVHGRGASSTMPQKRNPISSEIIMAAARLVREQASLMLDAMVQDLERATGPWHLEWLAIPNGFVIASGALAQANLMIGGLEVDERRMRRNMDLSGGLIVAEAAMMALAPQMRRQLAHEIVYEACREAVLSESSLEAVLGERPEVTQFLPRAEIARLLDPANYLGSAPAMVARVTGGASQA